MKRNDKHINKFLNEPLPDPEIPADDAWASMSDMLATGSVEGANHQSQLSNIWKAIARFKGLLIGASVVVTSAVVALIVLNAETKNQKHTENQSINSNIQDSASDHTDLKTNALKPGTEHTGISTTSPSETSPSEALTSETPSSRKIPSTTTSPETIPSKITHAPGAVGAAGRDASNVAPENPVISGNRRIEDKSKRSVTPPASSPRMRTGAAQARTTRPRDTSVAAGVREDQQDAFPGRAAHENRNEPGAFSGRVTRETENSVFPGHITRQNSTAPPANKLSSGQAVQETIPSFSLEKNTPAAPAQISLNNLASLSGRFESKYNGLGRLVKKPVFPNTPQTPVKSRSSIWQDVHFGPEWNINRSIVSTNYMLTGADSIKHPLRLAVPSVFVSKSWNKHTATFIFNPMHSYFGDKQVVAQRVDTLRITDSTFNPVYRNTNFIKALGINFSLQYQYQATYGLALVGGMSYARYTAALLRKEIEFLGNVSPEAHLTVKGRDALQSYIRPQQWNIRAGILFRSRTVFKGRLQAGITFIIPVSNLSANDLESVKSTNVQGSIRFLLK